LGLSFYTQISMQALNDLNLPYLLVFVILAALAGRTTTKVRLLVPLDEVSTKAIRGFRVQLTITAMQC
jgi:hypothetical protein